MHKKLRFMYMLFGIIEILLNLQWYIYELTN